MFEGLLDNNAFIIIGCTIAGVIFGAVLPWDKVLSLGRRVSPFSVFTNQDSSRIKTRAHALDPFYIDSARLLGQVCQIDGPLSQEERDAFTTRFFTLFPEAIKDKEEILFSFQSENLRGRNLAEGIAQFYWDYSQKKEELKALLHSSIEIVIADGAKNSSEEHILEVMARTFGVHAKEFKKIEHDILVRFYEKMGYGRAAHANRGEQARGSGRSTAQAGSDQSGSASSSGGTPRTEETLKTLAHAKHYRILGLEPTASKRDIKAAYRRLVKANHPDMAQGRITDGGARFREIQIAYEALEKARLI